MLDAPGCLGCGGMLLFSARERGGGLCGPCSRAANGTGTAEEQHVADEDDSPPRCDSRSAIGDVRCALRAGHQFRSDAPRPDHQNAGIVWREPPLLAPACVGCVAQRADNAALVAEVERLRAHLATLLAAYDAQRAVLIAVRERAAKEFGKPATQRELWDACEESAAVRAIREAIG